MKQNYGREEQEITVTPADWVAAYDLKKVTKIRLDRTRECYYVRRSASTFTNEEFVDFLDSMDLAPRTEFDVASFQENIAVVAPSLLYTNEYTCNCPIGTRRKLCKHAILVKLLVTKTPFPDVAPMRQRLNECGRNKRGRPPKFTPALSMN